MYSWSCLNPYSNGTMYLIKKMKTLLGKELKS